MPGSLRGMKKTLRKFSRLRRSYSSVTSPEIRSNPIIRSELHRSCTPLLPRSIENPALVFDAQFDPFNSSFVARNNGSLNWFYLVPVAMTLLAANAYQNSQEDEKALKKRRINVTLPPVPLPYNLTKEVLEDLDHRLVYVSGELLHEREMRLLVKEYESKIGLHVYTPLRRSDGSAVIINRGWVPPELKDPETRKEAQVTEKVTIIGHLLGTDDGAVWSLGGIEPLLQRVNVPDRNMWARADLKEMGEWVNAQPVLISALEQPPNPGGYPIGGQTEFQLDNWRRTLAYELTAAAVVMFAALIGGRSIHKLGIRLPWQKPPPPHTPFTD